MPQYSLDYGRGKGPRRQNAFNKRCDHTAIEGAEERNTYRYAPPKQTEDGKRGTSGKGNKVPEEQNAFKRKHVNEPSFSKVTQQVVQSMEGKIPKNR